jgi:hypothetical protein
VRRSLFLGALAAALATLCVIPQSVLAGNAPKVASNSFALEDGSSAMVARSMKDGKPQYALVKGGKPAPPGTYKLPNGQSVTVGKAGHIKMGSAKQNPQAWEQQMGLTFPEPLPQNAPPPSGNQ